jgi:hypothetical protein
MTMAVFEGTLSGRLLFLDTFLPSRFEIRLQLLALAGAGCCFASAVTSVPPRPFYGFLSVITTASLRSGCGVTSGHIGEHFRLLITRPLRRICFVGGWLCRRSPGRWTEVPMSTTQDANWSKFDDFGTEYLT